MVSVSTCRSTETTKGPTRLWATLDPVRQSASPPTSRQEGSETLHKLASTKPVLLPISHKPLNARSLQGNSKNLHCFGSRVCSHVVYSREKDYFQSRLIRLYLKFHGLRNLVMTFYEQTFGWEGGGYPPILIEDIYCAAMCVFSCFVVFTISSL